MSDELTKLNDEGKLFYQNNNYEKAADCFKKAASLANKYRIDNLFIEYSKEMAQAYKANKDYEKAKATYISILERISKKDKLYSNILTNLADIYFIYEDYGKAKIYYTQAEETQKGGLLKKRSPDYLQTVFKLATVFHKLEDYIQAEFFFVKLIPLLKKELGRQHIDYESALNELASVYQDSGNYAKAQHLLEQVLLLREKRVGKEHSDFIQTVKSLGRLYTNTGQNNRALSLIRYVLPNLLLNSDLENFLIKIKEFLNMDEVNNQFMIAEILNEAGVKITKEAQIVSIQNTGQVLAEPIDNLRKASSFFKQAAEWGNEDAIQNRVQMLDISCAKENSSSEKHIRQIEITLDVQPDNLIVVNCDGDFSHTFDISNLYLDDAIITKSPEFYGEKIYQALFPMNFLTHTKLNTLTDRIVLVLSQSYLQEIPWEYAYNSDGFLVQNHQFVRSLPKDKRIALQNLDMNIHVIAVPANPLDENYATLNIEGEWWRLKESILSATGTICLERTNPSTMDKLRSCVANKNGRIVHFMGHGKKSEQGAELCFENEYGGADHVSAVDFVQRLKGTVFMVFLNACDTASHGSTNFHNLAKALVEEGVPYALGMRRKISDEDSLSVTRVFYSEIVRGTPVEEAIRQVRYKLASSSNHSAIGIPVLYTALDKPATGFSYFSGTPRILDNCPPIELNDITQPEGTFRGRIQELKKIGKFLTGDRRPKIITIHGVGGQGKTALATATVERFAHAWPGGVWGINLESLPSCEIFSHRLACFLNIEKIGDSNLETLQKQLLGRLKHQRTLIVLDNAETMIEAVEQRNVAALDLAQFIRQQLLIQNVNLLITSRIQTGWTDETVMELDGLDPEAGAYLFLQCIPIELSEEDGIEDRMNQFGSALMELSEKIHGHPLGLLLLGKAFAEKKCMLSRRSLIEFIGKLDEGLISAKDKYKSEMHRHYTIFSCLELSFQSLSLELQDVIIKLSIFHSYFLPELAAAVLGNQPLFDSYEFMGIIMDIGTPAEAETAIYKKRNTDWTFGDETFYQCMDMLWQRGLLTQEIISENDSQGTSNVILYNFLPTVHSYLESKFNLDESSKKNLQIRFGEAYAVFARMLASELQLSPVKVKIFEKCKFDLDRGLEFTAGRIRIDYLIGLSYFKSLSNENEKSMKYAQEARELTENLYRNTDDKNENKRGIADFKVVLNAEAMGHLDSGNSEKAMEAFYRLLTISENDCDNYAQAHTWNNIGNIHRMTGNLKDALGSIKKALALYEKEKDRLGEAETLNSLGLIYLTGFGNKKKALKYFKKALKALNRKSSKTFNNDDNKSIRGTILNNLGESFRQLGKYQNALVFFEKALSIFHEIKDTQEPITLNNLAIVNESLCNISKAKQYYDQALYVSQQVGNKDVEAAVYVAMTFHEPVEYREELFLKAYKIFNQYGKVAFEASTLASLAAHQYEIGRTQEAKESIIKAIEVMKKNHLPQDGSGVPLKQYEDFLQNIA